VARQSTTTAGAYPVPDGTTPDVRQESALLEGNVNPIEPVSGKRVAHQNIDSSEQSRGGEAVVSVARMSNKKKEQLEKYERGTRSYTMSHIRGKDTKIEVLVRSYLFRRGLRFRKNDKRYPGRPDVVLPGYHTIVFVNGCFWHMHEGCSKFSMPKSNVEFWTAKLVRNRERDVRQRAELESEGWHVLVVWECELTAKLRDERLERLYREIVGEDDAADADAESAGALPVLV
jgi:DNA mismatch endonuclease, patch repair protein